MIKGGYQIINLENRDLRNNIGMQYEGIYELIEGTRKPILISGLRVMGVEYHDMFAFPFVMGTAFIMHILLDASNQSFIEIKVEDTDVVTVNITN